MKIQDKYQYDSSILGLNGIYQTVGDDSFFFNIPCILSTNHIITTGKTYIIVDTPSAKGVKMYDVKLVDVYYKAGVINMIVREMISQKKFNIKYCMECTEHQCTWMLVDLDYFIDKMNAKEVRQYCGKCDNTNKKSVSEIKSRQSQNDLLEFEF